MNALDQHRSTTRQVSRWTQILTPLSVVLSLVFVGIQVHQNTEAIRASTFQALAAQSNDINLAISENADLAAKYYAFRGGAVDSLDPSVQSLVQAVVRLEENAYYMGKLKAYDERLLARFENNPMYGSARFAAWWAVSRSRFAHDFQLHVDSVAERSRTTR